MDRWGNRWGTGVHGGRVTTALGAFQNSSGFWNRCPFTLRDSPSDGRKLIGIFVNWFFELPLACRLVGTFVTGLFSGSLVNWAIYQVCWNARKISPWSVADPNAPPRRWWDRLPVIGWFGLAREKDLHGTYFWIRPMLIEAFCGLGLAWLYLWEAVDGGLHTWRIAGVPAVMRVAIPMSVTHSQWLAHAVLFAFLIAATFIDFDERTVPDMLTVPGTVLGILFAGLLPTSLLSDYGVRSGVIVPGSLRLDTPFPGWCLGPWGLLVGIVCMAGWWYALLPKIFYFRRGLGTALRFFVAKVLRYRFSLYITLILLACEAYLVAVWMWSSPFQWSGLLSSLVGLAFAGGLVWAFRVVASAVLRQEAMGFGDVTLMAMIGSYIGWQPALIVFFIAPFAGVIIAVVQWIVTRSHEIAYGPYLALATFVLILNWPAIWVRCQLHFFTVGLWIPVLLAGSLGLMAILLSAWMAIKRRIYQ